ncbi:PREDICTED: basigin isoform X2 [Condylura cristata]|uniref:basigin isoform X2 n=1 Tax=Condylura cristata TaxID=143302 RepID=UPI0003343217|nr:PREDICTED: basigin isoform X2 [Condylura cristata]
MAAVLVFLLGLALLGARGGSGAESRIWTAVSDAGAKVRLTCAMNDSAVDITGHRWMKGDKLLREDLLPDLRTEYEVDHAERAGEYSCIYLPEHAGRASIQVPGPPKVKAVKSSENADEGDRVVLACKSDSFPPVLIWKWHRTNESGEQVITNSSRGDKYFVVSSDHKSELHILDLDVDADAGKYHCSASNAQGDGQDVITLRVRRHLAALWPFLGIVAEVLVLVTIIFIYEKRRKPDEVLDDDDTGSAPLKSSGHHMNDKDKSVRQRNAT